MEIDMQFIYKAYSVIEELLIASIQSFPLVIIIIFIILIICFKNQIRYFLANIEQVKTKDITVSIGKKLQELQLSDTYLKNLKSLTKEQLHLFLTIGYSDGIKLARDNVAPSREIENFKKLSSLDLITIKKINEEQNNITYDRTDGGIVVFDGIYDEIYKQISNAGD